MKDLPHSFNPVPTSSMDSSPPFREKAHKHGRKAQETTEPEPRHRLPGEFIMRTCNHSLVAKTCDRDFEIKVLLPQLLFCVLLKKSTLKK